jgi:hypothetical protein
MSIMHLAIMPLQLLATSNFQGANSFLAQQQVSSVVQSNVLIMYVLFK